jgi:hypothetical protein
MIKKITGLLLAAVLLVFVLPMSALAESGVDLSRVKFSSGTEPLVFKFGSVSIDGEVRQEYPFSKEEIGKLVKEALKAKGLTELDIIEANRKVDKAKSASQFTQEDINRIKDNIYTSAGVVPAAGSTVTIIQTIDTFMKSKSWDDIGTASASLLEDNMKEWVKETATGFVDGAGELGQNVNKVNEWMGKVTAIQKFCEMMMDEQARTAQKWTDIADGANAKRLLNDFYYTLQEKIDDYKRKSDEKGWVIDFNQAMAGRNFTFFGVDSNYQTWYLDMHMTQKSTNEFGSVAGEYEGDYSITAENEMSSFQSRANEAVEKMPVIAKGIDAAKAQGFKVSLTTDSQGSVYISRTISGTCKATIQENGDISLSLDQQKDETQVSISGLVVSMDCRTPSNIVTAGGKFTYEFGATDEDLKIVKGTVDLKAKAPDFNFSQTAGGAGEISVGWDKSIWEPWEGTDKTLKHAE